MYENRAIEARQMVGADMQKDAYMSRTIGQNINARIASLKDDITRLEGVREQLESGGSLLNVRIEDLRQAMNY